jgi:hypothetical protein
MIRLDQIEGYIKGKLSGNSVWAMRALKILFTLQTEAEKETEMTAERNGRGFNGKDCKILSNIQKQVELKGLLTGKQMEVLFGSLQKYWRQIYECSDKAKLENFIKEGK